MYMVLSVNKFQNILQKGAFDADFSTSSVAGFGMTTRRYMVLPISNFCFHSGVTLHKLCWLYGGRSALTVVALSLPG